MDTAQHLEHGKIFSGTSFFWQFQRSFTELPMDDLRVSGPHDVLKKLKDDASARLCVKYAMIFCTGESSTFEHLRRDRFSTLERCYIRATIKYVKRATSLLGLQKIQLVSTPWHPTTEVIW